MSGYQYDSVGRVLVVVEEMGTVVVALAVVVAFVVVVNAVVVLVVVVEVGTTGTATGALVGAAVMS